MEHLANLDKDFQPCIIVFEKVFSGTDSKKYTYTALKCGDLWYLSGSLSHPKPLTWEEMAKFLSKGVDEIFVVTDMMSVWTAEDD